MRKRFYILFVARDADGELRKIHIPLHYLYVFLAGAIIGMFTITGMAGSYTRMLMKVARVNEIRQEKEQLRDRYAKLEQVAEVREIQVASLGSIASDVSALYGLKSQPLPADGPFTERDMDTSMKQLAQLRRTALAGNALAVLSQGFSRGGPNSLDLSAAASAPNIWPVEGHISGPFGNRIDPFNGEGAHHRGIDISAPYGHPIIAPADGVVTYSDFSNGYGRMIVIDHGHGFATRYGHLSGYAVTSGQAVKRGQVIGYVGLSGRSTGPHLHYEVWVRGNPVNPNRFLRVAFARLRHVSGS